jgi:hypothetical protein
MRDFLKESMFLYQADNLAGGGDGRFTFTLINGGTAYAVTGLCEEQKEVFIPASYNGLPVTQINPRAFAGKEQLLHVVMPSSVEVVGDSAFCRCCNLQAVQFSDNIVRLGEGVFSECPALTNVKLPERLTYTGGYVFYRCSGLQRVIIPKNIAGIGYKSFEGCDCLQEVFYEGRAEDWRWVRVQSNDVLLRAKMYYYSESAPLEAGNYWRFGGNGEPMIW